MTDKKRSSIQKLGAAGFGAMLIGLAASPALAQSQPKWELSVGPWAGYNIKETNDKSSTLVGAEFRLDYAYSSRWSTYIDLVRFNTVGTSSNNGFGGRRTIGLKHRFDFGDWQASIGPKIGHISGKGVQDGLVIGPEIGAAYDLSPQTFLYARFAYDHDSRNKLNEGIFNGGLGVGFRY
ncbi:MAG: outer membrane beta-barrel protein [Pseudomonadota bacterium]